MIKRLTDWWTRPTWDEYLTEQAECLAVLVELDDLRDDHKFICGEHDRIAGLLNDCTKANHDLVGTYSNDVVALPFALRKAEELQAKVEEYKSYIDMMGVDSIRQSEYEEENRLRIAAEKEIERLRGLLMNQVEQTPVHSIDIQDGAVEVAVSPPHWAMKSMAMSFYESLANAPNWNAMEVGPLVHEGVRLVVTVRRMDGDTPEETVGKHRKMIERLLSIMPCDTLYRQAFTVQEARALINPTKKDD